MCFNKSCYFKAMQKLKNRIQVKYLSAIITCFIFIQIILVEVWKEHTIFAHMVTGLMFIFMALAIFIIVWYTFKKIKKELSQSEEVFHSTFENAAIGMASVTLAGEFLKVNNSLCEITGYTEEELQHKNLREITWLQDLDVDYNNIKQLLNGDIPYYHIEKRWRHKNKRIIWILLSCSLVRDTQGKPLFFLFQIQDITKSKLTNMALSQSERRYKKLLEFMPMGVFVRNEESIIFANNTGAKMMGSSSPDELLGKSANNFIYPNEVYSAAEGFNILEEEGLVSELYDAKMIKLDNEIIDIEAVSTSMLYGGKLSTLTVARDITEKKKTIMLQQKLDENSKLLKEALELDRLKTEFFANISHELRTPLNVMLGTIQLFDLYQDKDMNINFQKFNRHMKEMKQNCQRLIRMVNNLIDSTKIDSGFFEIHLENLNIVSVVEDIALSVAEFAREKGIELLFDTDIEELIMAFDPNMVERIMLNLLSNAIKFTKSEGFIKVNIQRKVESVLISVKDNGIGIPREKQDLIFERFRQVSSLLTREHEGSGIGLSLAKSLVELHDGSIVVASEYGKGSEFIVELPISLTENDNITKQMDYHNIRHNRINRINVEFADIYSYN